MRPPRSVSVLMPTWQGIEFLERVLASLARQRIALPWDFLAIDSGSTDGTWELLGRAAETFPVPLSRERIDKLEFDHGDTRNLLAARSSGELLVYLTQDAIPSSDGWLAKLVANFDDPRVGAAYCRNVPRPDADLLTRLGSEHDPGYRRGRRETRIADRAAYERLSAHERRLLWNFNDVASAVRRELWELHPFPRTWFGEDVLLARALLEGGWTVVYDDAATVEHSHDYSPEETYERCRIDGRFNAEWLDRICVGSRSDARVLAERQLERDRAELRAAGLPDARYAAELERARRLRTAAFEGLHDGGLETRRRKPTRMLARKDLSVLYVVHGFPPDTWAGTEVYTLELAREVRRRGHRVTILARTGAKLEESEGGPAEFSVSEGEFDGLPVVRMVHRLRHRSLRESYHEPRAESVFRALLARLEPDVVHFQHLIHLSAGLVDVAREHGCATLITCHDYWPICARVQLIRPNGVRCEHNMGSGCHLCVAGRGLGEIERLAKLDAVDAPALDALASGLRVARRATELVPVGSLRRWAGFADLRARQPYVLGAYAAADLRLVPSRFLRRKLVEAGLDAHATVYSDNGMRTDRVHALAKRPDPEGRVRFGFVGTLAWYKGADVLLRAMRRLAGRAAVLNVHGDFRPEADLHHAELARLAGPNVRFHGRFDNARLAEVYAGIDVLVVPSVWYENSPITIHEAHLLRTPVVASGIGGMAEYVRDGVDGLHFAVGDDADLAAKLARFLDEPDLASALSRDFPRVKSIEQDAAATEFRYRALVCARLGAGDPGTPRLLIDLSGVDTARRDGAVEPQGADMLLVRPGGGAVEYDVSAAAGGPRILRVEQLALAVEPKVLLGGRVLVDGREAGRLEPFAAKGRDERRTDEVALDLPAGAARVRIEPVSVFLRGDTHLRIARVAVLAPPRARAAAGAAR